MNRVVVFGIAMFFALVGLALLGGDNQAVAGHGCHGCGGCHGSLLGGHGCHGCGGCAILGHGCHGCGGCHKASCCGLFKCFRLFKCHGCHGCHGCGCAAGGEVIIESAPHAAPAPAPAVEAPPAPAPAPAKAAALDSAPMTFRTVSFRR